MALAIRTLSDTDLESADSILKAAFQRSDNWIPDLRMCRSLQPDGYFLACQDGKPVGMVGAIVYSHCAYVGLMAVHPENQRQGVGLWLMENILSWLDEQGVRLVKLDASTAGQPLYKKLGFEAREQVMMFQRLDNQPIPAQSLGVSLLTSEDLDHLAARDTQAFGADRGRLLRALLDVHPGRAFLLKHSNDQILGYLFAQRTRIGPWVMRDAEGAGLLLQAALSLPFDRPPVVAVPEGSREAIGLLMQSDFEMARTNRHMTRGPVVQNGGRLKIYGQASLFLG